MNTALPAALLTLLWSCSPTVRFSREPAPPRPERPRDAAAPRPLDPKPADMEAAIASLKGIPYQWGGITRAGMDCSGFVKKVFSDVHSVDLPHSALEQSRYGRRASRNDLRYGDLVFFKIRGFRIDHVGIYTGDGRFAHASLTEGVTVTPLDDDYYRGRFVTARRLTIQ